MAHSVTLEDEMTVRHTFPSFLKRPLKMSSSVLLSPCHFFGAKILLNNTTTAIVGRPRYNCTPRIYTQGGTTLNDAKKIDKREEEHYYIKKSLHFWDKFYRRHKNKFFKDRHYLEKDWGEYFGGSGKVVLEVGCGTGNTVFPLVAAFPNVFVHACDFSPEAVNLVKSHSNFEDGRVDVFVCDVAEDDLFNHIRPSSVDVVTLIFMLSAVSPNKMPLVLKNLKRVLKPNGHILVRDYAIGDLAQVKLQDRNQIIDENFCFRGDGTCSFYFSEDFLSSLFVSAGFSIVDVNTYCRRVENHARSITMERRWVRAVFSHT